MKYNFVSLIPESEITITHLYVCTKGYDDFNIVKICAGPRYYQIMYYYGTTIVDYYCDEYFKEIIDDNKYDSDEERANHIFKQAYSRLKYEYIDDGDSIDEIGQVNICTMEPRLYTVGIIPEKSDNEHMIQIMNDKDLQLPEML